MATLRIAIPSEGALYDGGLPFMRECGLRISRVNPRRYTAEIPALPGVEVLFQRSFDITSEVDGGSADLGLVGLDCYEEFRREGGDTLLLIDDLAFGGARLLIAVPDAWLDVTTVPDLADLSLDFRERGRELRIVTKYPRLVKRFLNERGVHYFTLVYATGGLEAGPIMGYADLVVDVSASGTTLRENHLRPLTDGVVMETQATIVGNGRLLAADEEKLALTKEMLERIEALLRARNHQRITANIRGESAAWVAELVMADDRFSGIQGPTVSDVYGGGDERWFAVQVVVHKDDLIGAVDHFRSLGCSSITVNDAAYVFRDRCQAYDRLAQTLEGFRDGGP